MLFAHEFQNQPMAVRAASTAAIVEEAQAAKRWVKSARSSRGVRRVRRARARAMPSAVRELQLHEHVCSPESQRGSAARDPQGQRGRPARNVARTTRTTTTRSAIHLKPPYLMSTLPVVVARSCKLNG